MAELNEKTQVYISFSENEYKKVLRAKENAPVLKINPFVSVLVHNELKKIKIKDEMMVFHFDISKKYDSTRYKIVRFDTTTEDYEKIQKIVSAIPIKQSNFLKYLILPTINRMAEEGEK